MKLLLTLLLISASLFAQVPTARPEPASLSYSLSELNLLPSYTRAGYKTAIGQDAPAFDITKAPKFWFDATAIAGCAGKTSTYQSLSLAQLTETPFSLPACDASVVNIPLDTPPTLPAVLTVVDDGVRYTGVMGLEDYLQNQVRTNEIQAGCNGGTLCTQVAIKSAALVATVPAAAKFLCNWQTFNDQNFKGGVDPACGNTAPLVAKYSAVIQAWGDQAAKVQTLMGLVAGTPCIYCAAVAAAPVPMPVRPLFPDERIVGSLIGEPVITRVPTSSSGPAPAAGDGFTAADRATLQNIWNALKGLSQ